MVGGGRRLVHPEKMEPPPQINTEPAVRFSHLALIFNPIFKQTKSARGTSIVHLLARYLLHLLQLELDACKSILRFEQNKIINPRPAGQRSIAYHWFNEMHLLHRHAYM